MINMGFTNTDLKTVPDKTRQPKQDLADENYKLMFGGTSWKSIRQVNEKILIAGENSTGKTSLALNLALHDIKDDEIVMYVEIDNSGAQLIKTYYLDYVENEQLRPMNAVATKVDESGKTILLEEKTVNNAASFATVAQMALDNGFKIKTIIIDGLSFLLKYCEAVMRIDKRKAVDDGIPMGAWKVRNDKFTKFYSPFMLLPTSVIFLAHEDFVREMAEDGKFANVKQLFIDECSIRIITERRANANPDVEDYVAIIKKHRADVTKTNKEYKFFSVNNKSSKTDTNIDELANVIFLTPNGVNDD